MTTTEQTILDLEPRWPVAERHYRQMFDAHIAAARRHRRQHAAGATDQDHYAAGLEATVQAGHARASLQDCRDDTVVWHVAKGTIGPITPAVYAAVERAALRQVAVFDRVDDYMMRAMQAVGMLDAVPDLDLAGVNRYIVLGHVIAVVPRA